MLWTTGWVNTVSAPGWSGNFRTNNHILRGRLSSQLMKNPNKMKEKTSDENGRAIALILYESARLIFTWREEGNRYCLANPAMRNKDSNSTRGLCLPLTTAYLLARGFAEYHTHVAYSKYFAYSIRRAICTLVCHRMATLSGYSAEFQHQFVRRCGRPQGKPLRKLPR